MALFLPALFGLGNPGTVALAVVFLLLFGIGWGFFDCNNMPILCQITRPQLRATGYGFMNFVSISCGGFGDWGFGVLEKRRRAPHAHLRLFHRRGVALADHRPAHPSEPGGALPMTSSRFHGIIVPMVTPLVDRDTLDVAGLERLIEHILAGGVHGVFVLGTTGEGPGLSYRRRQEIITRTCRQVGGRVPVLVGITDTSMPESLNVARWAADAGATALVVAPPYYIPEAQPELQEYLDHLVPELPLPLFLYNMPALTKVSFELETVRRAMDEPRIVGIEGQLVEHDLSASRPRPAVTSSGLGRARRPGGDARRCGDRGRTRRRERWRESLPAALRHDVRSGARRRSRAGARTAGRGDARQ